MKQDVEAPWPYNLISEVYPPAPAGSSMEDSEKGVEYALNQIPEEIRQIILAVFRDGEPLKGIADSRNIDRNSVKAELRKGIRYLRHRRIIDYVVYGYNYGAQNSELTAKREALKAEMQKLKSEEKELEMRRENLQTLEKILHENGSEIISQFPDAKKLIEEVLNKDRLADVLYLPIEDLDLPVRAFNCLKRGGFNTTKDLVDGALRGDLRYVRNLGRKSLEETVRAVYRITGIDIGEPYGISPLT